MPLSACVDDVVAWMLASRLQLNTGKTNLLWCATARCCHQLFGAGPTSSTRQSQSEISKFTSTPTSACNATFRKPLPAALPFCVSCAAFNVQCRRLSIRRLSSLSSCPNCRDYGSALLVGLPGYLYSRLQSVLNAAARSIASLRRSDHITDTLASFHWLTAPERVQFKLATIVFRSLNGSALSYLSADLRRLFDMPSRRRLRSSLTHQLDVPQSQCSQCSTVGDRAFAVAGARLWNSLPPDIVATLSRLTHFHSSAVNSFQLFHA